MKIKELIDKGTLKKLEELKKELGIASRRSKGKRDKTE